MRKNRLSIILATTAVVTVGSYFGFAADDLTKTGKPLPTTVNSAEKWSFLPDVIAKIGDKNLTKAEFIKEADKIKKSNPAFTKIPVEESGKLLANEIIDMNILLLLAAKDGIKPEPALIDELLKNYDKEVAKLSPEKVIEITARLNQQGSSFEKERERFLTLKNDENALRGIVINKWIEENVVKKIVVSDKELELFYHKNKQKFSQPATISASHILIMPKPIAKDISDEAVKKEATLKAKADAKIKCVAILAKIKNGADFTELATTESECPSGKSAKGSLGKFGKGKMVKKFEDACNSLEIGQISEVVETQYGYHIIRLDAKDTASVVPFEQVKQFINSNLTRMKVQGTIKQKISDERKKIGVELFI